MSLTFFFRSVVVPKGSGMSGGCGSLWLWRGREPDCIREEQGPRQGGSCSLVATLRSAVSLSTHDLCTVPQQNKERELIAYEWNALCTLRKGKIGGSTSNTTPTKQQQQAAWRGAREREDGGCSDRQEGRKE
ncbi:hypothetical protein O3P69_014095 [Scylla paramamosain]|uniref:Uncharacterized protein n=1 Tax=Scylla paramamosain TaxID=85552 RepID=A0AAW0SUE5_SCYPA